MTLNIKFTGLFCSPRPVPAKKLEKLRLDSGLHDDLFVQQSVDAIHAINLIEASTKI